MTETDLEGLRKRLPLLRDLEERGFVEFRSDGVHVVQDIPLDDVTPALQDEFALADEWGI
jgi:hypothetical protein